MGRAARRRETNDDHQRIVTLARLDEDGWITVPGVIDPDGATALADRCTVVLAELGDDVRTGDKRVAGTRRLTALPDRLPEVSALFEHPDIVAAVAHVLGPGAGGPSITFRSPQPGFGAQKLHADAAPMVAPGPWQVVTSIVALCDFDAANGATGIIPGSHRRPDIQRHSGNLEHHPDEIVLTGAAGTAFVFIGHVLHRGRRNDSTRPRPALQAVWGHIDFDAYGHPR